MRVFPPKYFLKSSLFWGTRRCFRETQSCACDEDPPPLSTHVPFRPKPRQLSGSPPGTDRRRIWPGSSTDDVMLSNIATRLNSHPFGSGGPKKKRMEHMLCCDHMASCCSFCSYVAILCPVPGQNLNTLIFGKNPPLSCTTHWIGAEETWRVANVMLGNRSKRRHLKAECFLVSN